jgi:hypothetical protein
MAEESFSQPALSTFEVAIWCTVRGESEEEVRDLVFQWCQRLKSFLKEKLAVRAIEVGLPTAP